MYLVTDLRFWWALFRRALVLLELARLWVLAELTAAVESARAAGVLRG